MDSHPARRGPPEKAPAARIDRPTSYISKDMIVVAAAPAHNYVRFSNVFRAIHRFLEQDQGQDLAEYCLITALIVLIALAIFWRVSGGIQDVWDTANTTLAAGNSTSGSAGTSDTRGDSGH